MQQQIGGQPNPGGDNNPILQAVIVHLVDPGSFFFEVVRNGGDLDLTWESQGGELYRVRSETDLSAGGDEGPATWPIHDGHEDIEATPPRNTLTIARPDDATRFFVVEAYPAPPETILGDDFESGQGDWTAGSDGAGGDTAWELGSPTTGPGSANSGDNCFATNLDADYGLDAEVWLRSPPIDLTGAGEATLSFFEFKDIEEGFDFGTIRVLDAADDSELAIVEDVVDGDTGDWEQSRKPIPAEGLGKVIVIEFRFTSDDIQNFAGWYIDDFKVTVP
ncbi:MAG: hypothetical protein GWO24_05255 [Akkermansiaceae bacterium]|nr:hypothetical protein [Akkermansiaceae bacterium]